MSLKTAEWLYMSFSVGIVGLPNVGKSTLFSLLTKKPVPRENYPFCTIEPNVGVVQVPDERLDALARLSKSEKIISTIIEFVDIAGLVKGAHQGHGLGNKFLSHIREVDAIAQVVRAFRDSDVAHVDGNVDPLRDISVINLELIMADLELALRKIREVEGKARSGDEESKKNLTVLNKVKQTLEQEKMLNSAEWQKEETSVLKPLNFLTAKSMFYVLNSEDELALNTESIPGLCVALALDKEPDLSPLITLAYKTLALISFLTSGEKETKAWTIRQGAKAPQAAGVIHTDFEKGFIRAEVVNWKDLVDSGSLAQAKAKGLWRLEGKDYVVRDGDVCHFRFSV